MEKEIKDIIKTMVLDRYTVELDDEKNMLSEDYPFKISDIIYIISYLEQQLNKKITNIFHTNDSSIFVLNNMVTAIIKIGKEA